MRTILRWAGLALAMAFVSSPAAAQSDYPNGSVKIIVANTPGTAGDNLMRIVAARLSEVFGKQFYVVNHAGAGGTIGAEMAARAAPDGYTLLSSSTPQQSITPHLYKLKYNPLEDFLPLTIYAKAENVLVVNPSLPFQNVRDIIAYGKANPGKIKMSNAGIGFQSHIANVMFANMSGIDVLHVPYRGAASMTGVMGGEADMTIAPLPATIGFIRAGRVRAIAVTGLTRSGVVPELPTINESGIPGYAGSGWYGIVGPKELPPTIAAKITDAITKILAEEPLREQIRRAGGEPWGTTSAEMIAVIKEEYERYGNVIRAANIKLE